MRKPKQRKPNDLSRSLAALDVDHTLIAVVEMSLSSWLVAGIVPGVERQPLKKLRTDACTLLELLHRWRAEAVRAGHNITRIAVAFEAGRDGFWLARWLKAHGIEAHVIHASSIAVSREHRRAKCMARPRVARQSSEINEREVLHQCIRPHRWSSCSGPAWVSARIRG